MNTPPKSKFLSWMSNHKILSLVLGILALLVIILLIMAFIPFSVKDVPGPDPATSYDDALSRLDAIADEQAANPALNPVCYTKALTHGEKTENAIVLDRQPFPGPRRKRSTYGTSTRKVECPSVQTGQ